MSVSFVAISSGVDLNVTSITFSHTIAAGSDIWLVVGSGVEGNVADAASVVTGVDFDSNALALIVKDPNVGRLHSEMWAKSETAKTADVVVSYAGTAQGVGCCAADYTGADGFDAVNSLEVDGPFDVNISLTTNTNNSYVVEFASTRAPGAWVEDSSQTSRKEFDGSGSGYGFWDILKVSAGAQAMDLTAPGSRTGVVVAELKEKAGLTQDQDQFGFYNDDGNEASATIIGAQNVNLTQVKTTPAILRIQVNNTGDLPTQQLKIQCKKTSDPDSAYADVPVA